MNVFFRITSSSKCRVWQHSWGKENTARQSNGTCYTKAQLWSIHWSVLVTDCTGDRLPSLQPSAGSFVTLECFQMAPGLTGCQTHCTLQCDGLHNPFYSLKNLCAAFLCLGCLYARHWESPAESTLRNGRFFPGERGNALNSPSPPAMWSSMYSSLHERICRRGQC